jgi:hypothetical protein
MSVMAVIQSFSNKTSGKRERFTIHCPPVFNDLTHCISSFIIFSSAIMVIRFLAEKSNVLQWRPSTVPSCNITAATPKLKRPPLAYFT